MDTDRKILRIGAAMILCAVLVRWIGNGQVGRWIRSTGPEELARAVLFLQTGRVVRPAEQREEPASQTEPAVEAAAYEETEKPAKLSAEDVDTVEISNLAGYDVDIQAMLAQDLQWELKAEEPTVLILHTHGTESYRNTENYPESSEYRTEDPAYNMISVGERLAELLQAGGIRVIHDRTPYDLPTYSGSYAQAREALQKILEENPSICLVLDLHRDAMTDEAGRQMAYTQQTPGGTAAKLMLVSGSDAGGLDYPNWQDNLTLAVKLQAILERQTSGLCRPLSFRTGRYNQDLFPNMILVEVGAAGNTRQEALLATELLAAGILEMAAGAVYE